MTNTKRDVFVSVLEKLAVFMLFAAFLFVTVHAYITTYGMDIYNRCSEHFELMYDSLFVNVVLLLAFIALAAAVTPVVRRFSLGECIFLIVIWFVGMGVAWVMSAHALTGADSKTVYEAALAAAKDDFSLLAKPYFKDYPFQLGFAFVLEMLYRILPESVGPAAAQYLNVFCLAATMCGLVAMTKLAFPEKKAYAYVTLLAILCVQPIPFSIFVYGNIPALTCGVYAVLFFLLAVKGEKLWWRIIFSLLSALMLGLAVMLKYNSLIFTAALVIVAVLKFIRRPKVYLPVFLAAAILASIMIPAAVKKSYERRTGLEFGDGVPMTGWLAMGLSEAYNGPGWYNGAHTVLTFHNNDYDSGKTSEEAMKTVRSRLEYFASSGTARREFFTVKIMSQWNEPTYQSIWVNQVRGVDGTRTLPASLFCSPGSTGEVVLKAYMNVIQQIILFLFTAFVGMSLMRRGEACDLFPIFVIIVGGFLYHLLFEAKSQYVLGYFILMLPAAGAALEMFAAHTRDAVSARRGRAHAKQHSESDRTDERI